MARPLLQTPESPEGTIPSAAVGPRSQVMHQQDRERRRYGNERRRGHRSHLTGGSRRSPEHEPIGRFQPIALHVQNMPKLWNDSIARCR
jgi:hypothetical protein